MNQCYSLSVSLRHKICYKKIYTEEEQSSARSLFDKIWSSGNESQITSNLLKAMLSSGAYLSGAYCESNLVGASFAFPGVGNELHAHSHMTAVLPDFRDQGIGHGLKLDQWNWAKLNSFSYISWTYDPLVRRNAKLNIVKLGVDISAYHPNFYGEMQDALNAGDESDRLMVSWRTDTDAPMPRELIHHPKSDDILIEIPEDIVAIRSKDQRESFKWRRQVRDQFLAAFDRGGKVIGFSVNNEYVVRI